MFERSATVLRSLFRSIRWRLGLAGGRPKKGQKLVQIAPMLNCPLWGVTTPDTCQDCPYFGGTCLPAPHSPLPTLLMVKCSYDGGLTKQETLVLNTITRQRGLTQAVYRCVSCGNPFIDADGVDVPACPRFLCQARVLVVGRGSLGPPGRGTMRTGNRQQESKGMDAGIEVEGGDDEEEFSFRPRGQNPPSGETPGAKAR